jgi:hypothetical protein
LKPISAASHQDQFGPSFGQNFGHFFANTARGACDRHPLTPEFLHAADINHEPDLPSMARSDGTACLKVTKGKTPFKP